MGSSNRHWPSMFKTKSCNPPHHQWHPDNINSPLCHRPTPYSTGCEDRSPEPKPRWNPRPEQIRILEAIFNSGMVNPPRDEIRLIRIQLQQYGQVGDANVFYWFQNRKSRTKHKLRVANKQPPTFPSSSPSSSDGSSPTAAAPLLNRPNVVVPDPSPVSSSVHELMVDYFQGVQEQVQQQQQQPVQQVAPLDVAPFVAAAAAPGFGLPYDLLDLLDQQIGGGHYAGGLRGNEQGDGGSMRKGGGSGEGKVVKEQLMMGYGATVGGGNASDDAAKAASEICGEQNQNQMLFVTAAAPPPTSPSTGFTVASTINQSHAQHHQGLDQSPPVGPPEVKSTVFINDVAFEVAVGPINVREAFGEDAVLLHSSGHPAVTDEWGVTVLPLQHGAFYYLVRTLPPPLCQRNLGLSNMVVHELPY